MSVLPLRDMVVRRLSDESVNYIAAGEIIDRPASIVKELVENSIDSAAKRIDVSIKRGGKKLVVVTDDGVGMTASDLELAVERHCTSKLDECNLDKITTLGFRGEGIPSIGAVAKLTISTRHKSEEHGWTIDVISSKKGELRPIAFSVGTKVEVANLFFVIPARLKFLKTEQTEALAVADMVKRLALATPEIHYKLITDDKSTLDLPGESNDEALFRRASEVIGREFADNAVEICSTRDFMSISGYAGVPTYNRAQANCVYCNVNGRPVRDKMLLAAVRAAYDGVIESGRYPVVVLDIQIDYRLIDVNIHPTKAEVRFRDAASVRNAVVSSIRNAISSTSERKTATNLSDNMLKSFLVQDQSSSTSEPITTKIGENALAAFKNRPLADPLWNKAKANYLSTAYSTLKGGSTADVLRETNTTNVPSYNSDPIGCTSNSTGYTSDPIGCTSNSTGYTSDPTGCTNDPTSYTSNPTSYTNDSSGVNVIRESSEALPTSYGCHENFSNIKELQDSSGVRPQINADELSGFKQHPLGIALTQVHGNFIISQTTNGIILVDAHAAHERLLYEQLKKQMRENGILRQILLIPEIVELPHEDVTRVAGASAALKDFGLIVDSFGPSAVIVREVPEILGNFDVGKLVRDLADDLVENESIERVESMKNDILSLISCHGAVRTGRNLGLQEMNALLRDMENTKNSSQCNHGRPTFIELKLKDIKLLFGRK